MARQKIEQSQEQAQLYAEVKKIIKRANQRILSIEKLTNEKGTFATKQLYDYLNVKELSSLSKKGRIKLSKEYSIEKLLNIKKATEQFLNSKESTIKGIKEFKKKYEDEIGKPIDYKQADTIYKSNKNYTWIYEYIPKSEFWGVWVQTATKYSWSVEDWTEQLSLRIGKEIDVELKADLESLYVYCVG